MANLKYTEENATLVRESLVAPFVRASLSTLGGKDRASIMILVSLEPRDTWNYGYVENSLMARFALHGGEDKVEMFSKHYKIPTKFRKAKIKSVEHAIEKIQAWIDTATKESPNVKQSTETA